MTVPHGADQDSDSFQSDCLRALSPGGALAQVIDGFTPRPVQQSLALRIAQTISQRGTLVAEAGTGTGKTYAYLVPALLSGRKVLLSTGTRPLQDQLFRRDLPRVQAALGHPVQAVLLKGRTNYVCPQHLERNLASGEIQDPVLLSHLHRIQRFVQTTRSGDRAECADLPEDSSAWNWATSTRESCLGQDCPALDRCFVNRARREAMNADLVVINHPLFCADLVLREDALGALLPTADVVIFDEAHGLPETALEYFGESVSSRQCLDWARDFTTLLGTAGLGSPEGRACVAEIEAAILDLRTVFEGHPEPSVRRAAATARTALTRWSSESLVDQPWLVRALERLQSALEGARRWIELHAGRHADLDRLGARAADLGERLVRWSQALETDGAISSHRDGPRAEEGMAPGEGGGLSSVIWAERSERMVLLRRAPLSVAPAMAAHRTRSPSAWILLSATLAMGEDFAHFTASLGLEGAQCERWGSPFDFPRQGALWVPQGLGPVSEPGHAERLVRAVWPLIKANQGRAFILCTTLRAIAEVGTALARCEQSDPIGLTRLLQGDAPRPRLLARFTTEPRAVLVGSASFWEGVDVPGDALSLVIIDKLPFAPPDDPVLKARDAHCRRRGGDPFFEHSLPAAALALKQGAGRLIRSERDRGVLVIGDERLVRRGYGRRLLAALPPLTRVEDAAAAVDFLPAPAIH